MQITIPTDWVGNLLRAGLSGKKTHLSGLGLIFYAAYSITTYLASVPPDMTGEQIVNGLLQTEGVGIISALFGAGLMAQRAGTNKATKTVEEKIDELSAQLAERDKAIAENILGQLENPPLKGPST